MRVAREERRNTRTRIFRTVARLVFKLFPALELYVNILGAFPQIFAKLPASFFYERAVRFILDQQGSVNVSLSTAVSDLERSCGELGLRELDQQGRLRRAERNALTQPILMGLFGGIALICPVLIMVLSPSQNTNLITVSVATIVFAIPFAIGASDSTGKDILAATAAYTAMLVVFFGTSSSSAE